MDALRIRVRLFAMQRQQVGWRDQVLEVPLGATIETLWEQLAEMYPVLQPARASVRFARNGVYADPDDALSDGDELAIIPPVAGGGPECGMRRDEDR